MICVPNPATEGSKVPLAPLVIPVPVQAPPLVAAVNVIEAALKHTLEGWFMVASEIEETIT